MGPCGDKLVPGQDDVVLQVRFIHVRVALEKRPDLFEEREVFLHAERYDMLDADRLRGKQRFVHEDVGRHDDTRLVGAEELDEVFRGGQDVDVVDDGADLVERVEADDAGHAGDRQDGDDVPFPDALCQERLGGFVDALEELTVADLMPHVVEGVRVQIVLIVFVEVFKETHLRQRVLERLFAEIGKPGPVDARVPGPGGLGQFFDLLCGRLVQSHTRSSFLIIIKHSTYGNG